MKASGVEEDASGVGRIAELAKFNAVVQGLAGTPEAQRGDYRATGVVGVLVEIVGEGVHVFSSGGDELPGRRRMRVSGARRLCPTRLSAQEKWAASFPLGSPILVSIHGVP